MRTITQSIMLDTGDRISIDVTGVEGLPPARLAIRGPSHIAGLTVYLTAEDVDRLLLDALVVQRALDPNAPDRDDPDIDDEFDTLIEASERS